MKTARLLIVDSSAATDALYRQALSELGNVELVFERDTAAALRRLEEQSFNLLVAAHDPPRVDALALSGACPRDRRRPARDSRRVRADAVDRHDRFAIGGVRLSDRALGGGRSGGRCAATVGRSAAGSRIRVARRQVERPYSFDDIIGASPAMRRVFETIQQVADSDVDVLVHGETGTGKELIARSIHRRSRRAEGPFVPVDCGAIPESLLESEFFGHEKGAFTGADNRRIGLLEFADHGTFFLDELGELPLVMQAKLLRTLQERKIRRLGGARKSPSTSASSPPRPDRSKK